MVDASPKREPRHTGLRPPQYGMRTLLAAIALLSVLFAVMASVGMLWSLGLLMVVLLIAAHVVGNVVGTQLRGSARRDQEPPPAGHPGEKLRAAAHGQVHRPSHLGEKHPLGRALIVLAGLGLVAGGTIGGMAITAHYSGTITIWGIILASLASAILGGLMFAAAGSLILSTVYAWNEMWRDHKGEKSSLAALVFVAALAAFAMAALLAYFTLVS